MANDDLKVRFGGDTTDLNNAAGRATGIVRGFTGSVGGLAGMFGALAGGIAAAFSVRVIGQWAAGMGAAAERASQLGQMMGMTTGQVQAWDAVARNNGKTVEDISSAFGRLTRAQVAASKAGSSQAAAFRALGIDAKAATDQNKLLLEVADRFAAMPDGARKQALSMQLFGKTGRELIPILNQGAEAIRAQQADALALGAVFSDNIDIQNQFMANGQALDDELDRMHQGFKGISQTIFAALAPAIIGLIASVNDMARAWVESYRSGGMVKQILDAIATAVNVAVIIFQEIASVAGTVWRILTGGAQKSGDALTQLIGLIKLVGLAFVGVGTLIEITAEAISGIVSTLITAFTALGRVIREALTGHFAEAAKAGDAGWAAIEARARKGWDNVHKIGVAGQARVDAIMSGPANAGVGKPKGGGGGGDLAGLAGGAGAAKSGPGAVAIWEQQLHAQEIASNDFFSDQTANELAFWRDKLALTATGSKDWLAVQSKIFDLSKTLAHQAYDEQIAAYDEQVQAAQGDAEAQIRIERDKVAFVLAAYHEGSVQAAAAHRELERMERQHAAAMRDIEKRAVDDRAEIARGALAADLAIEKARTDALETAIEARLDAGSVSNTRAVSERNALHAALRAAERAEAQAEWEITLGAMHDKLALDAAYPDKVREDNAAIETATAAHYQRMRVMDAEAASAAIEADARRAAAVRDHWRGIVSPIVGGFAQMTTGLLERTTTWHDAVIALGNSLLESFIGWVAKMTENWIVGELAKTAATRARVVTTSVAEGAAAGAHAATVAAGVAVHTGAEAVKTGATAAGVGARVGLEAGGAAATNTLTIGTAITSIFASAGRAAAGAYAALAGIPIIGPIIAPVAAATAFIGAAAFVGKIASAQAGWGSVPADGMMTELHKEEMVLPERYASPLRSALEGAGSGGLGGAPGLNLTYAPHTVGGGRDVVEEIKKQPGRFRRWLANEMRNGEFKDALRAAMGRS